MKAKLMGVHSVKKTLADGSRKVYHYAWRGGPRIDAEEGSREFIAEYLRLTRDRDKAQESGNIAELIRLYVKSPEYRKLSDKTRADYESMLLEIQREFFDLPLSAVDERGARTLFLEWRDKFAKTPRRADMMLGTLRRLLSFAEDRERIARNPLRRVKAIHHGSRRDTIWSDEQIATFQAGAPQPLVQALTLALWSGQRQGDLLRLTWRAYDGQALSLRQRKTGATVRLKVSKELKAMLDGMERKAVTILTNAKGQSWGSGFKTYFAKVSDRLGIEGPTFHDARGTFCTLAYRNGASFKDIADVTGHSEKEAEAIIRKHYLVASGAVERIEARTKNVNQSGGA